MDSLPRVARLERRGLFRERNFRLLLSGQAISRLGDGAFTVALAFAVLDMSGSASDLGLVLAARAVPMVVFVVFGGVVADRLPRRAVMVTADLVRMASQGTMAALVVADTATVPSFVALAAISGTASAFFAPAATGLLPEVVRPERLQHANALRGFAMAAGEIAGPILAGILVAAVGPGSALAVDAASFAASAALLVCLQLEPRARSRNATFLRDLQEGWVDFRSRRWLITLVVCASAGNFMFAAFTVLGPAVAKQSLGGAAAWGLIISALGAGSLMGSLLALRLAVAHPARVSVLSVSLLALPLALLALPAPTAVIAGATVISGVGLMVAVTLAETTFQRHVPRDLLSRLSAYDQVGSLATQPIGLALWGPIALALGTSTALWVAAGLQVVVTLSALAVREVRELPPMSEDEETWDVAGAVGHQR